MTIQHIRTAMHQEPFRPFSIIMSDGRSFLIKHPDFIAYSPNGRDLTIYEDENMHLIEMLLVAEIKLSTSPEPQNSPQSN
jgi:hypothetical protein